MTDTAQVEQLLRLFKQVLGGLVDELVSEKLAAMPLQMVTETKASPAWKRIHVSMSEAAEILGLCTRTIYDMHSNGEIELTKVRRRTFVPVAELERLCGAIEQNLAPAPQPGPPKPPRVKKRRLYPKE